MMFYEMMGDMLNYSIDLSGEKFTLFMLLFILIGAVTSLRSGHYAQYLAELDSNPFLCKIF